VSVDVIVIVIGLCGIHTLPTTITITLTTTMLVERHFLTVETKTGRRLAPLVG
jgi:hypothetical protein